MQQMKSFGVWYKKREGDLINPVFSIHVNFWSNSIKKDSSCADLDIGIKISNFKDVTEVVFHCPFSIQEGDVRDLYEKLTKKKNANIVFNAEGEIETRELHLSTNFGHEISKNSQLHCKAV